MPYADRPIASADNPASRREHDEYCPIGCEHRATEVRPDADRPTKRQRETPPEDTYRVLPHRDVLDCTMYSAATGEPIGSHDYEHVPCGMPLTRRDVVDANWCPHCPQTINKAAQARGKAARAA